MTTQKIHKQFLPTLDCLLLGGSEAITSFADKPKRDTEPKKHLVTITQKTLEELSDIEKGNFRTNNPEEKKLKMSRAQEVLRFLNSRLSGFTADKEYPVGDELYLCLSNNNTIEQIPQDNMDSLVVCQYEGERLHYSRKGLKAEIATFTRVDPNIRREGVVRIEDDEVYDEISCKLQEKKKSVELATLTEHVERFHPNQYIIFDRSSSDANTIVGVVEGDIQWHEENGRKTRFYMDKLAINLHPLHTLMQQQPLGKGKLQPRNLEQAIYMHALQQEHISMVFVTGGAGTGKTIIGYGSALAQTLPQIPRNHPTYNTGAKGKEKGNRSIKENPASNRFENIYITKAPGQIGNERTDIGHLPGDERAKLGSTIQSYIDAHDALRTGFPFQAFEYIDKKLEEDGVKKEKHTRKEIGNSGLLVPDEGIIHIENFGKWRGRTMEDAVVFLDEAQNLRSEEMIHLIQRMGFGSQYIISGDYESQIDDQNISATNNGLFYAIKHFISQPYSAVISLEKSQRHMAAAHAHKMPRF